MSLLSSILMASEKLVYKDDNNHVILVMRREPIYTTCQTELYLKALHTAKTKWHGILNSVILTVFTVWDPSKPSN